MHILLIYALVNGLAHKIVEVVKQPLETKLIEEVKEKPPEELPPVVPKLNVPPPPFIPPPEVQIQTPVVQTNVISATIDVKPVTPQPPVTHPAEAPKPRVRKGIVPVFKVEFTYPRRAMQGNVEGNVLAHAYVAKNGTVTDVQIVQTNRPGYFETEVIRALKQWKFTPDENDYIVEVPVGFKLND